MKTSTITATHSAGSSSAATKRGRKSRRLGIIGITFVAVMGSAVAFAAWTSSGTGASSDVTAGTAATLAVTPDAVATGLVPGTPKTSSFKVTNNNSYPVSVSTVSVTGFTVTGGTGCTALNSGVTGVVLPAAVGTVVAGGGTAVTSANFKVTVSMTAASDNGCQSAIFTPILSISGASS